MPNRFENGRQFPYPLLDEGKGYEQALASRSQAILSALMNLLPSNYESTVVGPEYTLYLKAFATELGRVALTLERLAESTEYSRVPSEFLWETVGYLVFINGKLPELGFDDESFRDFLQAVISIYFKGSTPAALAEGIALFTDSKFTLKELFNPPVGSPFDISDQFAFLVDFELQGQFPQNPLELDANIQLLLEIIRPAHTLYRLRFVFGDDVSELVKAITDTATYDFRLYHYDDARKDCEGLAPLQGTEGVIAMPDLSLFEDSLQPLHVVQPNAQLTVFSGVNQGTYRVAVNDAGTLQVVPRFRAAESGVVYQVEIDRAGAKKEISVVEEVPLSNAILDRLTIAPLSLSAPVFTTLPITITVFGAVGATTSTWDLDGDQIYDDATGLTISYSVPATAGTYTLAVRVTDELGRQAKQYLTVEATP
jgi:hypothetical protein